MSTENDELTGALLSVNALREHPDIDGGGPALGLLERGGLLSSRSVVQRVRAAPGGPDASRLSWLACSVGIMAYNEEANIANAVATVLGQQLTAGEITELIVVASGCTDRTADIVAALAREDRRIRLIVEESRAGKASAINQFIGVARSPILLMVSADVLVEQGTIDALLQHFRDPTVGMTGGHPIPINDEKTFLGHTVHLLWRLHDQIARESPKLGEIVAFRNVFPCIPSDTAVDELSIQALVTQLGYRLVYEPGAVVYNRGPSTVSDFVRQRRRIAAGHHQVAKQEHYAASTTSVGRIGRTLVRSGLWTSGAIALEAAARGLGYYDFRRHHSHAIWGTVTSTKVDLAQGVAALTTGALTSRSPMFPALATQEVQAS
jgi:biofilm PGA synthesis N-glycosyltransferase PgaC